MTSDLKMQKRQHKHEERMAAINLAKSALTNPVVELVGGFYLAEYINRNDRSRFIDFDKVALETGITVAVVMQQLGPEGTRALIDSVGGTVTGLVKSLPALAAVGG